LIFSKNDWADLNHAVIERAVGEWRQHSVYALAFAPEADISSICKDDVTN